MKIVVYCNKLLRACDIVVNADNGTQAIEKARAIIEDDLKSDGFDGDLTRFYTVSGRTRILTQKDIDKRIAVIEDEIARLNKKLEALK